MFQKYRFNLINYIYLVCFTVIFKSKKYAVVFIFIIILHWLFSRASQENILYNSIISPCSGFIDSVQSKYVMPLDVIMLSSGDNFKQKDISPERYKIIKIKPKILNGGFNIPVSGSIYRIVRPNIFKKDKSQKFVIKVSSCFDKNGSPCSGKSTDDLKYENIKKEDISKHSIESNKNMAGDADPPHDEKNTSFVDRDGNLSCDKTHNASTKQYNKKFSDKIVLEINTYFNKKIKLEGGSSIKAGEFISCWFIKDIALYLPESCNVNHYEAGCFIESGTWIGCF